MTEMEKALYADAVWLVKQLDALRSVRGSEAQQMAHRQVVILGADELERSIRKYLGED